MNYSILFIILNVVLIYVFYRSLRKKNLLTFFQGGKWWLTWLAVGIITLMDELTSIYYAPSEAYRFIGLKAIFYVSITSIFIRFLSTRMVEISEILELNNIKGGGVYSFSYLVWGPKVSFIAVGSILVDYILTATLSTVSAVTNGATFFTGQLSPLQIIPFSLMIFWGIAFLNILGIKENAKFTYGIFIFASIILMNLLLGGILNLNSSSVEILKYSTKSFVADFTHYNPITSFSYIVAGIGSCILAYSGIESVLQTASLTKGWHEIRKGYVFLAFTVGIVTPLLVLLAMSSGIHIDPSKGVNLSVESFMKVHETDLIPNFAANTNGKIFAVIVSILASMTLIMAVNTAMVASAELIEKIAERYQFHWLIQTNKRQSLYRIHIFNAAFYSFILFLTSGKQSILAEMYAVGLVASFCINAGSLLKYRFSKGSKQLTYRTSRIGTLIIFIFLVSIFSYIAVQRYYGTMLWLFISSLVLFFGIILAKKRAPEIPIRKMTKSPMDVVFAIVDAPSDTVHIHFKRPKERDFGVNHPDNIFVSFYHPRTEVPEALFVNHLWLSIQNRMDLYDMIYGLLETIAYDVPADKNIVIHFGWPMSSWIDRLSIGFMVFNIMRIPRHFPQFSYVMEYFPTNSK